ncbi:uncharacterized protein LOC128293795 [Gossypium arboreum]|uniref:uncharacterized protein LOC128293795 n=1 Tax=Gossypium arboreum TaxID=29729 RepID=UPI0022F152B5|nr:uncharacterized protein LOC128293795 [Gossypium arboreum]
MAPADGIRVDPQKIEAILEWKQPKSKLAKLYVSKIVRLHQVLVSIISDRDPRFTFRFRKKLHEALCTRLDFSTTFHHQTDDTKDKVRLIRDQLNTASDRKKSYADLRRKEIEYFVGDLVFLNVSPWKKVLRFGQKGKLSPKFIGIYRILKRVGLVANQLELPLKLDRIHDVFHVSMRRRYRFDPTYIVSAEEIEVRPDLTFEEEPIQILEHYVKVLRKKSIPLVKVLWHNHSSKKAT